MVHFCSYVWPKWLECIYGYLLLINFLFLFYFVFGLASVRSYKIGVVDNNWLVCLFVCWLVRIFLIFCMKLADYKDRKVAEPDFSKKFLICRYSRKGLQISQKSDTLIFFSKTALHDLLRFWPELSTKYDLQFEWNLFFRKNCNFEIFDLEIVKK